MSILPAAHSCWRTAATPSRIIGSAASTLERSRSRQWVPCSRCVPRDPTAHWWQQQELNVWRLSQDQADNITFATQFSSTVMPLCMH